MYPIHASGSDAHCLMQARYGIAWGAVGAARDCFEQVREYALEREQFGGQIGRSNCNRRRWQR